MEHVTRTQRAKEFLVGFLIDGPRFQSDIVSAAKHVGIGERTLRRTREDLGVKCKNPGFQGRWMWGLK
jgi:hypothetical protein